MRSAIGLANTRLSSELLMPATFRKVIALSQIIGGVLTFALLVHMISKPEYVLAPWYFLVLQSFAVGGVVAGWWLWRADPRAMPVSRVYQGLQIVQVQMTTWGVGIIAGLFAGVVVGDHGVNVTGGLYANINLYLGQGLPRYVSVNVLALAAFVALVWPRWSANKLQRAGEIWADLQQRSIELDNMPGGQDGSRSK